MVEISVDKKKCIGCNLCVSMLPEVFELDTNGKSVVKNPSGAPVEKIIEISEMCPTRAIKVKK
ncbi:MAG: ferredoxin [Candidatus Aenigmarchaeota archaeon]|nr:ferredoxin [Candidatus Aenigmarchaeota archaeon]MDW8160040.1 ferredoxin [Candidatus Aenigmarchaeota archaeon]